MPDAATLNVTLDPALTVWLAGWVEITGTEPAGAVTLIVVAPDVEVPVRFVSSQPSTVKLYVPACVGVPEIVRIPLVAVASFKTQMLPVNVAPCTDIPGGSVLLTSQALANVTATPATVTSILKGWPTATEAGSGISETRYAGLVVGVEAPATESTAMLEHVYFSREAAQGGRGIGGPGCGCN